MPLLRITKPAFDLATTPRVPPAFAALPRTSTETSWFSNKGHSLLGVILLDRIDNDWGFVILKKQADGRWGVASVGAGYVDGVEAETMLEESVKALEGGEAPADDDD